MELTILLLMAVVSMVFCQRAPPIRPGREGPIGPYFTLNETCTSIGVTNPNECDWFDTDAPPRRYLVYLVTLMKTWDDARSHCQQKGDELVIINDCLANSVVQRLTDRGPIWIGAMQKNCDQPEDWKWVDGSFVIHQNWATDFAAHIYKPDCSAGPHQAPYCIQVDNHFRGGMWWTDEPCDSLAEFVCMKTVEGWCNSFSG